MTESAALWLAGIFAAALVSVLGIIATAVMRERNGKKLDPTAPLPWERYQADVLRRIDESEKGIDDLKNNCREESGRVEKINGRLELLAREDQHLKERLDRIDGQGRS